MRTLALFIFVLASLTNSFAQLKGKVVGVHDGDTFTLLTHDKLQVKVRVHGVDCPELKQDFGRVTKQFASDLLFGKEVVVNTTSKDKYGRAVGIVILPNGRSFNEELLRYGYAWHYVKYDKNPYWQRLEDEARKQRLGLWKLPNAQAPWEWRKERKKKKVK